MMRETTRRGAAVGALALVLALGFPASLLGQGDSLVGARVVPRSGAVLRQDDDRYIDAHQGHHIFTVERTFEEWIWIAADGLSGWAKPADVITLDKALDYYTNELRDHPNAAWAYIMRGRLYEEMKEPGIALADYNEAVRLDPKDGFALYRRGAIRLLHKRDPDRAIRDFTEALQLDPKLAPAYALRGNAYRDRGALDLAIADYTEAVRLDPKDVLSYHGRAIAWQSKGSADRALLDYDEVIRLAPDDPVALLNRGNLWSDRRELDKAIANYTEAIRIKQDYVLAYNNRGIAWRAKMEYDKAISDHNIALRLAPNDATGYLDRGIAWKKMGEFERALEDYNQAARIDPKSAEALNGRAWVQATCPDDKYRNGQAAYEAAVRSCELTDWKQPNHLDTLAAAYAESRDFKHAVEWQTKAIALADDAQKETFHTRLLLYQAKKPYRDATATPPAAAPPDSAESPIVLPPATP